MVYFVSDIHLGGGNAEHSKRAERAFCRWLDMVGKDARTIYLLGDIFDFWFEYHTVAPQGYVRVLGRLAELADRGVEVVFYAGNHDMWCLDYLTRECGVRVVYEPQVEVIGGRKIHLAHGDNMNIDGQHMLKFMNGIFRSSVTRWMFRWLIHPDIALSLGHKFSGKSRKSHGMELPHESVLDQLVEYAEAHHREHAEVKNYIFGHMHLPGRRVVGDAEVLFLSDWSREIATYAQMDSNGVELKSFNIDETISRTS